MDDSGDPRTPPDGADLFRAWLGEHAEAGDADPVREYLKQVSKVPGLTAIVHAVPPPAGPGLSSPRTS